MNRQELMAQLTDFLETEHALQLSEANDKIAELTNQRDDLLAALKMARAEMGNMPISEGSANWDETWGVVNVAIAKAEAT